jgi:hypothetical protein
MANPNKFTAKEVLNKVLLDSSGNAVTANSVTSQEALNSVLDTTNNRLNMSLAGGTISGDVTISGDLTVQGGGSLAYDEVLTGSMSITRADAVTNPATDTNAGLLIENTNASGSAILRMRGGDGAARIMYGENNSTDKLYISPRNESANYVVINHLGQMGIGTDSPSTSHALTIAGDLQITDAHPEISFVDSDDDSTSRIYHSAGSLYIDADNTSSEDVANSKIRFTVDDSERFVIDANSRISLSNSDSGDSNTIFGKNAGDSDGAGDQNVFVGELAGGTGTQTDAADGNVGVGYNSLTDLTSGQQNTAIGSYSSDDITSGSFNTAVGRSTLATLTTGSSNVAVGRATFSTAANDESHNIAIGNSALGAAKQDGTASSTNREIKQNIAIGEDALMGGTLTGTNHIEGNIAIGYQAMDATGANNQIGTIAIGKSALGALTSGTSNTAVGFGTAEQTTTGGGNTVMGYQALTGDSDGDGADNVAIGHKAMLANVSPSKNVAIGDSAMRVMNGTANGIAQCVAIGANAFYGNADSTTTNTNGTIAIGYQSLKSLTTGGSNTAIGYESQLYQTDGANNTSLGYKALRNADNGESLNTVIGMEAGQYINHASSDGNTIVGTQANVGGTAARMYNTVMGYRAMGSANTQNNIGANENVFIGAYSGNGTWVTAGCDGNTAVGYNSLSGALNGATNNVAIGKNALEALTTGDDNVVVGQGAADALTTGNKNIAIGRLALSSSQDADSCVAIGYAAMNADNDSSTDGSIAIGQAALNNHASNLNLAIGFSAGKYVTSGGANTAIGYASLGGNVTTNLTGNNNTVIGHQAGRDMQGSADGNVIIGRNAAVAMTSGANNTLIGTNAGDALVDETHNVAIGTDALGGSSLVDQTVIVGSQAGAGAMTAAADGTVAVGYAAGSALTSGAGNTAVGFQAGNILTTGGTNTIIGHDADVDANSRSGCIVIGSGLSLNTASDNVVEIGNDTNSMTYDLDGGDITVTSDVRTKKNIKDTKLGLEFINKLRPITYQTKPSSQYPKEFGIKNPSKKSSGKTWDGLIAQEVKEVMNEMNVEFSGWGEGINTKQKLAYGKFVMPLIKAVQELSARVEELEKK